MNKEELSLVWKKYKSSYETKSYEQLVGNYIHLVKYVANRLAINLSTQVEVDELISYGVEGLLDAIEKYDIERNIKFETYAITRIRGSMIDGLRAMDWVPVSVRQKAKELERAYSQLEAELERAATDEEMAKHLGVSLENLHKMVKEASTSTITYLEDFIPNEDGEEKSKRIADYLKDESAKNILEILEMEAVKTTLAQAVGKLPEKEKQVITLYYFEGLTLKEIGLVLGLSESRISQLHTKAVLRMRSKLSRIRDEVL
ncbi:MAG: FliA/WhiG family RNA polymerase sigma factor [Methylocystaceae bacterium]